jgi:hypothetical protein
MFQGYTGYCTSCHRVTVRVPAPTTRVRTVTSSPSTADRTNLQSFMATTRAASQPHLPLPAATGDGAASDATSDAASGSDARPPNRSASRPRHRNLK